MVTRRAIKMGHPVRSNSAHHKLVT